MSKPTPGPWVADGNEVKVKDGMWMSVCTVDGAETDGLNEANAQLCAAAPELLHALKSIVERMWRQAGGHSHPNDEDRAMGAPADCPQCLHDSARAAIAKAEGRAE